MRLTKEREKQIRDEYQDEEFGEAQYRAVNILLTEIDALRAELSYAQGVAKAFSGDYGRDPSDSVEFQRRCTKKD